MSLKVNFFLLLTLLLLGTSPIFAQTENLPAEYQQLLPRGRIAAISQPKFVAAAKAKISPESWILGVVVGEEARAYSLNLLNSHEVVNDQIDKTAFAVVW